MFRTEILSAHQAHAILNCRRIESERSGSMSVSRIDRFLPVVHQNIKSIMSNFGQPRSVRLNRSSVNAAASSQSVSS